MDFDLRDWLLILGPVFITGVLIHGYWRMRRGRGDLKMALDKSFINSADEDGVPGDLNYLKAELPNGGARITRDALPTFQDLDSLQLDEKVPVLMESVDLNVLEPERGSEVPASVVTTEEQNIPQVDAHPKQVHVKRPVSANEVDETSVVDVNVAGLSSAGDSIVKDTERVDDTIVEKAPPAVRSSTPGAPSSGHVEKFVVVHVTSEAFIEGQALLETIVSVGMTFGEMDIFHMEDATGHQLFSLANSVEPGTFLPAEMDQLMTPGVVMFMRVHEVHEPVRVYDQMIDVAMKLCADLGAELQDESRSVMTSQTIEHCRQGILDYQYKHSA